MNNLEELQYPIGRCQYPEVYTPELIQTYLMALETFPKRLELVVQSLDQATLNERYREGGWTLNQVIHHCADSHMNMLVRLKLTLTEEAPIIKPYNEAEWALQADFDLPFNNAITLLYCVHARINAILRALKPEQHTRKYFHPQYEREFTLNDLICLYAWHGDHHLAHITSFLNRTKNV